MIQPTSLAEAVAAFQRGDLDRAGALAGEGDGSAEAEHLLGLIHCRRGDFAAGVGHLRRAAEAEPGSIAYRVMLARALIDDGRASEALEALGTPRGTSPAELALLQVQGEAAEAIGDLATAADAWQRLSSARPADVHAWAGLGRNLFKLTRFAEAEQAYRQAVALAPADLTVLHELGSLFERTNQGGELGQLLDRALATGISKAQLADLWAVRELRAGRFDAARELVDMAQPGSDPVRWHRLRARIADAADEPADAFAAATAMHDATQGCAAWRERSATFRQELRDRARIITPEWAARLPKAEAGDRPTPAFLVGFPRSGTTLLDTFLMGHARTTVIEEQGLLVRAGQISGPIEQLPECSPDSVTRARVTYFDLLARHVPPEFDDLVIDKAPLNMLSAPLIHALFGTAPIIFAQRHPCDAVLSGFMQSFTPNLGMASFLDIRDAADFYDAAMSVWAASCEAMPLNTHTVVYEELVRDPEATLRPLVQFLGLGWDERMLDHQATAKARGPIHNPSSDQVVEPLSDRPVGRWRRYEKQLEPVLPVLLPWAERLGYR